MYRSVEGDSLRLMFEGFSEVEQEIRGKASLMLAGMIENGERRLMET